MSFDLYLSLYYLAIVAKSFSTWADTVDSPPTIITFFIDFVSSMYFFTSGFNPLAYVKRIAAFLLDASGPADRASG